MRYGRGIIKHPTDSKADRTQQQQILARCLRNWFMLPSKVRERFIAFTLFAKPPSILSVLSANTYPPPPRAPWAKMAGSAKSQTCGPAKP